MGQVIALRERRNEKQYSAGAWLIDAVKVDQLARGLFQDVKHAARGNGVKSNATTSTKPSIRDRT